VPKAAPTASTPESGTVAVNTDDLPLYYELWRARNADPSRKPLLVLGGLVTDTVEDWRSFAAALSSGRDVLILDMRGVGRTGEGTTPGDYSVGQLNVDVQDLIEAIWQQDPGQQPVVVGCSDRGKVALAVGLTAAQRISGLITCGTSPGGATQQDGPNLAARNTLLVDGTWITSSEQYVEYVAGPEVLWPFPGLWHARLAGAASIEGVKRYETFLSATVGGVQFVSDPTVVMHGSSDSIYLAGTGPALATAIGPNASFQSVDGPHAFWLTNPTGFIALVEAWVQANVDTP
jgi:pimeloyl-ACP methyl ester carboxylesterase